jgi:hypothetical protein
MGRVPKKEKLMGLTAFPNGVSSFGVPVMGSGPTIPVTTGKYFFVHSGTGVDDPGYGTDSTLPFKSLDYAIGKCTAAKKDVIIVMPGHAETITAAATLTLDVSGVSIIGLGNGLNRPTFTMGAAAATVTVSAANCQLQNCVFVANYANVAICFTVGAKDFVLADCLFYDTSTILDFRTIVATTAVANAADGLTVLRCTKLGLATDGLAFVSILEANTRLCLMDNYVNDAATGDVGHFMIMGAFDVTQAVIARNLLYVTGATNASVGIFITGSSTASNGIVASNRAWSLDTGSELFMTATLEFALYDNLYCSNTNAQGYPLPAIDS